MKSKISLVLLMILMIRVPVFVVESDDATIFMKVPIKPVMVEIKQLHSVSLTPIIEYYSVSTHEILLYQVNYQDQGGAGMPNHENLELDNGFSAEVDLRYNEINMLIDQNNEIIVDDELIDLTILEKDFVEIFLDRQFVIEYLFKVGAL